MSAADLQPHRQLLEPTAGPAAVRRLLMRAQAAMIEEVRGSDRGGCR